MGRTAVDGVCVAEQVADYIACVRAQGARLDAATSQRLLANTGHVGPGASTVADVSERLQKFYTTSDSNVLEIIKWCDSLEPANRGERNLTPSTQSQPSSQWDHPPFISRIYYGSVPYKDNELTAWIANPKEYWVEVWINRLPTPVVVNSRSSAHIVAKGDHAGQTVPVIPEGTPMYGHLQVDTPGSYRFETWCYTEVPGIGLVQVKHQTFSDTIPSQFSTGLRCD